RRSIPRTLINLKCRPIKGNAKAFNTSHRRTSEEAPLIHGAGGYRKFFPPLPALLRVRTFRPLTRIGHDRSETESSDLFAEPGRCLPGELPGHASVASSHAQYG